MTTTAEPTARNEYVDWLRAFSLIVVVLWHWAFTILTWSKDGPHASSPLGFMHGFWLLTWLFQVMPLFFYVGGYVHLQTWLKAQSRGVTLRQFVFRRMHRLAMPALMLLLTWVVLGTAVGWYFDVDGMARAVKLVVSPLWFLGVYLMLIAILPISLWAHRRYGVLVLVWLAGLAMCVDIARFRGDLSAAGWLNMLLIWALAHQAGFFYQQIIDAPRRVDWSFLWGGLFGLVGMVFSGLYPGSMVGVPGEKLSNMAPPTFVMVALLLFQIGAVEVLRPRMETLLPRPRWRAVNATINQFALPLFLFHTTGMAAYRFAAWFLFDREFNDGPPTLWWWLTRPLAVIGPLLFTLPVIYLFARTRWVTPALRPELPMPRQPTEKVPAPVRTD